MIMTLNYAKGAVNVIRLQNVFKMMMLIDLWQSMNGQIK